MDAADLHTLLEGLQDYFDAQQDHPLYPPKLRHAMNRLALHMGADYPATATGLFKLFEQPLSTWWRGEVPASFDGDDPLLVADEDAPVMVSGKLSSAAQAFLDQ